MDISTLFFSGQFGINIGVVLPTMVDENFVIVGESAFLVTPLLGMANALGSTRRTTKAVEVYNRAIAIVEQDRGVESEELVVPLSGLGNLLVKEGKADLAENTFTR